MIFKKITKDEFRKLVEGLIADNITIAPVARDRDGAGQPVYRFERVLSFEEMALDYTRSYSSLKNFFIPFREELSRFDFEQKTWEQNIHYTIHPRVIVGVRACDIAALLKLDDVLLQGRYPSPYYTARRKNTFLIGLDHEPLPDCFCRSLQADTVSHGFDLFLTDIGEEYFMQVNSSRAMNLLNRVETGEITEREQGLYKSEKMRIASLFISSIDVTGLSGLMDIEFESAVWKKYGERCLSCGGCAMVCPTCYCFTVNEQIAPSLRSAKKELELYSCNLVDFAEVAGGHNFRPLAESRLKYRFYHQHRGFVESYDEPKCVGCNRCGVACPAGIRPVDVIRDLQLEDVEQPVDGTFPDFAGD